MSCTLSCILSEISRFVQLNLIVIRLKSAMFKRTLVHLVYQISILICIRLAKKKKRKNKRSDYVQIFYEKQKLFYVRQCTLFILFDYLSSFFRIQNVLIFFGNKQFQERFDSSEI